jgi:hypothetical protein
MLTSSATTLTNRLQQLRARAENKKTLSLRTLVAVGKKFNALQPI